MGRDRTEQPMPDLFSTDRVREVAPTPTQQGWDTTVAPDASSQRHILPKNLNIAVKQLSDGDLDLMHAATLDEMKRRGIVPRAIEADSTPSSLRPSEAPMKRSAAIDKTSNRRPVKIAEISLTFGQVNAVRAAFKAGVTPSRIARQFGIPQANVRKALASDEKKR
jgi:hypothetical protein